MSALQTPAIKSEHSAQPLAFVKMQGLGNDFIVLDGCAEPIALDAPACKRLADRRLGIGCDQILLIERSQHSKCDFRYRIYNADGGEVEQCGNGVRCVARYLWDRHGLAAESLLESPVGPIHVAQQGDLVAVDMGKPRFAPEQIPFLAETEAVRYPLTVGKEQVEVGVVSIGNPHAVMAVEDLNTAPVTSLGPLLSGHAAFPNRTNVEFMQRIRSDRIGLRVYERGVGETQACGTGACAAMVVARRWGLVEETAEVRLPGGSLTITWPGPGHSVTMVGPARYTFWGHVQP